MVSALALMTLKAPSIKALLANLAMAAVLRRGCRLRAASLQSGLRSVRQNVPAAVAKAGQRVHADLVLAVGVHRLGRSNLAPPARHKVGLRVGVLKGDRRARHQHDAPVADQLVENDSQAWSPAG